MRRLLPLAALLGGCLFSGAASAYATVTATYDGGANFGAGSVGYENGSIAPNPNSTSSLVAVGVGGDSFTTTSSSAGSGFATGSIFNTWCVDIFHWEASGSVTFNIETGNELAGALNALHPGTPDGAARVTALIELANQHYSSVNNGLTSAAFQLAVWAIAFDKPNTTGQTYSVSTTNPGFSVDAGTLSGADNGQTPTTSDGALANQWLASLGTAPNTGNYQLTFLSDGPSGSQDMITFTEVPEPGSMALVIAALLGCMLIRRKKA